jgi:muconolactone delta-isomerase
MGTHMAGGRRMASFDTQTARYRSQFGKWVPIWRAGGEWPVLIPKLLAIARSLDKILGRHPFFSYLIVAQTLKKRYIEQS